MLIRVRVLPIGRIVLLTCLSLSAGDAMIAQSAGTPLPESSQAASPAMAPRETSFNPQGPLVSGTKFEDVVRLVQQEGRSAPISKSIALDLSLITFSDYMSPVPAHALEDADTHREIYVTDDSRDVLFTTKADDGPVVYLTNRAGVLQKAGQIKTGRYGSQSLQRIPKESAAAGLNAEKEFWIKICSDPEIMKQAGLSQGEVKSGAVAPVVVAAHSKAEPTAKAANQPTVKSEAKPAVDKHSGAQLTVASTPDGAEIEIDRNVVGKTPTSVPLSHGEHWVTLRKAGYQLWRRRIKIEGSPLELNAELLPEKEKVHWF